MRRGAIGVVAVGVGALILWFLLRGRPDPNVTSTATESSSQSHAGATQSSSGHSTALPIAHASNSASKTPRRTVRDRERRDQMREKIYRAFGRTPPPPGAPRITKRGSSPSHADLQKLDKEYVQERLREDFQPLAKECYDAALKHDPSLAGKMIIEFTIVGDESVGGIVDSATLVDDSSLVSALDDSALVEKELSLCMLESMMSMSFAPPKHGGITTVRVPFVLALKDGGPDKAH